MFDDNALTADIFPPFVDKNVKIVDCSTEAREIIQSYFNLRIYAGRPSCFHRA